MTPVRLRLKSFPTRLTNWRSLFSHMLLSKCCFNKYSNWYVFPQLSHLCVLVRWHLVICICKCLILSAWYWHWLQVNWLRDPRPNSDREDTDVSSEGSDSEGSGILRVSAGSDSCMLVSSGVYIWFCTCIFGSASSAMIWNQHTWRYDGI